MRWKTDFKIAYHSFRLKSSQPAYRPLRIKRKMLNISCVEQYVSILVLKPVIARGCCELHGNCKEQTTNIYIFLRYVFKNHLLIAPAMKLAKINVDVHFFQIWFVTPICKRKLDVFSRRPFLDVRDHFLKLWRNDLIYARLRSRFGNWQWSRSLRFRF